MVASHWLGSQPCLAGQIHKKSDSPFVGINQWLYVTVAACPASLLLERVGVARHRWDG